MKALRVKHTIGRKMQMLLTQLEKIMKFPTPKDLTGVCAFLGTINITHQCISNYSELACPLSYLIEKVNWCWAQAEQLSFELLKIKSTTLASIYRHNLVLPTHLYTDASEFTEELVIMQFRPIEFKKKLEIPVVYNLFTFSSTQQKYLTYKKKLYALTRFVIKYDYLCNYLLYTIVIYIDYKPLIYFLKTDAHKGIYGH